jgi:hypothetical protein
MLRVRDRYFDALRAVAIFRVIVFHMFGFVWMTYFPAMGIMFALGGSLMASSIERSATRAVTSRVRRLLPALWALGAVLIPLMMWHGWKPGLDVLFWILPVATPPGDDWALDATVVIWYLVTYLWLVLLSPLLWRAFRRWPVATTLLPLLVLAITELAPIDLGDGRVAEVIGDVACFGACWVVGFAHRTGQLRRMHWALVGFLAAVCITAGLLWAFSHATDEGVMLSDIPLGDGLYSLGLVLLALRVAPPMGWLARIRPLDATVTLVNSRAVTIYLWHNVAIALSFVVGDRLQVWRMGEFGNLDYMIVAVPLIAMAVLTFGWIEDVAARRRPRLFPIGTPQRQARHASTDQHLTPTRPN